jgi:co-chaperonin GroES (HSP10)
MAAHDPFADSIIYTPDSAIQPSQEAQILEVGADVDQVEAGKVALVPQFAGTEVKFKGEWYLLLPESEIMAYVEGK